MLEGWYACDTAMAVEAAIEGAGVGGRSDMGGCKLVDDEEEDEDDCSEG